MAPHGKRPDEAAPVPFSVTIDGALVRIVGSGFWSVADVDAHFDELRHLVSAARPRHSRFNVLVDLRASAVQTRETTDRLADATRSVWTPDDRIALVLRAGLARMQMNRIVDDQNHQAFDNIELAQAWLDRD